MKQDACALTRAHKDTHTLRSLANTLTHKNTPLAVVDARLRKNTHAHTPC